MVPAFLARRSALWFPVLIGLLALALRLVYVHEIAATPLFDVPVVDAKTYVDDALYLNGVSWAGRPAPFWQPPLYPYTLAVLFGIFGENYFVPRLFQALLGAGICVLTYFLGRRLFSPIVALGAGLAAAVYGPLIYFGGELLPPVLAIFLNLLLLLSLLHLPGRSPGWALLSGLLLGLSALTVANILLFLPFLLFWIWHTNRNIGTSRTGQQAGILLLGCVLTIAPVTLRNHLVGHDLVLISHNAGVNFFIGNNPDFERTVNIRPGRDWARLVEMPEREAGIERPSEKSRYFFARSWEFISGQPFAYLHLQLRKLYHFWRGDEIRRNLDPYFARNDSLLLRLLLWKHGLAFPFGLVAPLALIGLVAFWRDSAGRNPEGRLLILFLLVYAVSVVLFFVTSRYRLPLVPLLLLFAGWGVRQCLVLRHKKALIALPVLLLLTNVGAGPMDTRGDAHQHFWLGYAYEQKGMSANALREYQYALERSPDFQDALLSLAALYGQQKKYAKAVQTYQQFLEFYPEETPVRFLLANTYLLAHRYDEAVAAYEKVMPQRPEWADLYGRLGYAYLMAGKPEQAAEAYRRTLTINPDSSLVRYQLARLYETEGKPDAAIAEYSHLLEQEPENADAHTRLADLLIARAEEGRETVHLEGTPRTRAAENHLRQAIRLSPNALHPRWSLGMLLARQERYSEAIEPFERIIQIAPHDYQAHLFLGHLYKRTGHPEKAAEHFARYSLAGQERQLKRIALTKLEQQIEKVMGK